MGLGVRYNGGMTETACPFCNADDRILKENDHAIAILSNPRKVPGHFLVLPKRHIEEPWKLTADELTDIFKLIFFIEERILGKLGEGVDIRQSYRPFKKEDAIKKTHVLFHVIPRYQDDYIFTVSEKFERDLYVPLDDLERKEVEKLLK